MHTHEQRTSPVTIGQLVSRDDCAGLHDTIINRHQRPRVKSTLAGVGVWLLLLASCPMGATAAAISTFDTDTDGWTHASGGDPGTTVTWSATGGKPGGRAVLTDASQGNGDYFAAPAKFLGNDLFAYGKQLTFDIADIIAAPASATSEAVAILGDGIILTHGIAPLTPNVYESVAITLDEQSGWTILNGGAPTLQQFQGVLSNVTELLIQGDFSGGRDVASLDNVALGVPEPAALTLMMIAGIGMIAVFLRRAP